MEPQRLVWLLSPLTTAALCCLSSLVGRPGKRENTSSLPTGRIGGSDTEMGLFLCEVDSLMSRLRNNQKHYQNMEGGLLAIIVFDSPTISEDMIEGRLCVWMCSCDSSSALGSRYE